MKIRRGNTILGDAYVAGQLLAVAKYSILKTFYNTTTKSTVFPADLNVKCTLPHIKQRDFFNREKNQSIIREILGVRYPGSPGELTGGLDVALIVIDGYFPVMQNNAQKDFILTQKFSQNEINWANRQRFNPDVVSWDTNC